MRRVVFATLLMCVSLAFVGIAALDGDQLPVNAEESTQPQSTPADAAPDAPANIVARVDEAVVTSEEFQRDLVYRWKRAEVETGQHVEPDKDFRLQILNELIDGLVLQQLAAKAGIEVQEELVQEELEAGKERLGSDEAYQQYLSRSGLTEDSLREEIRRRLLTETYVKSQVKDIATSEAELLETYPLWKGAGLLYRSDPTADVARILVRPESDAEAAWEAARQKLETVRQRIMDGADFEAVAEELVKDDDLLTTGAVYSGSASGRVPPEIDERMFTLPLGEVSEPFKGASGWQIIKVLARHEPGDMSYESARDIMETQLQARKITDALRRLIADAKSKMNIEIFEGAALAVEVPKEINGSEATPPAPDTAAPEERLPDPA